MSNIASPRGIAVSPEGSIYVVSGTSVLRFDSTGRVAAAVVPTTAGWERPLWFAAPGEERAFRYSSGPQCWWPAAEREAQATRDGVALFELSPFTTIDVTGRDALALLQQLCANDVDVDEGRAVYCAEDASADARVFGGDEGRSPRTLRADALGDWMKAADARSRFAVR